VFFVFLFWFFVLVLGVLVILLLVVLRAFMIDDKKLDDFCGVCYIASIFPLDNQATWGLGLGLVLSILMSVFLALFDKQPREVFACLVLYCLIFRLSSCLVVLSFVILSPLPTPPSPKHYPVDAIK
jgi:hypothetical protein